MELSKDLSRIIIDIVLAPFTWVAHVACDSSARQWGKEDSHTSLPFVHNTRRFDEHILWIQDMKCVNRYWCTEVTKWFEINWRTRSWAMLFRQFIPYYLSRAVDTFPLCKRIAHDYLMELNGHFKSCTYGDSTFCISTLIEDGYIFEADCLFEVVGSECSVVYDEINEENVSVCRHTTKFSVETGRRTHPDTIQWVTNHDWAGKYVPVEDAGYLDLDRALWYHSQIPFLIMPQLAKPEDLAKMVKFRWGLIEK